ncbi:MAG: permease [Thermaerobacter sp.]|nr:permease [Thermaerobacter sp.]
MLHYLVLQLRYIVLPDVTATTQTILLEAAFWLVLTFLLGGLIRGLIPLNWLRRRLGGRGARPVAWATFLGMLLPMCSCGAIPLGISLYYFGARLPTALAFMGANPIINPAAVLLSYALLGPRWTAAYLAAGFLVPVLMGVVASRFGGLELEAAKRTGAPLLSWGDAAGLSLPRRVFHGLRWGFLELGPLVSLYVLLGAVLTGVVTAIYPRGMSLDAASLPSLLPVAAVAGLMYVCAVAFIPAVAYAVVALGLSPGGAMVFLIVGAATNLPELLSIWRLIGRRAVLIYGLVLIGLALVAGWLVNRWLGPSFFPAVAAPAAHAARHAAAFLYPTAPLPLDQAAMGLVILLGLWGLAGRVARRLRPSAPQPR